MRKIALIIKRRPLAEGIIMALKSMTADVFQPYIIDDYRLAETYIKQYMPDTAAVEIPETGECTTACCLELCRAVRRAAPGCRLLMICPENVKDSVKAAMSAKKTNLIDDFVFYDASLNYIASKIFSM